MSDSPFKKAIIYIALIVPNFAISLVSAAEGKPSPVVSLPMEKGWKDASMILFNDANQIFEKEVAGAGTENRERELGVAVTLLNVQPRTRNNLDRARALLEKLATRADDNTGIFAKYFLARMDVFYETPPRFDKAQIFYRELIEHHAGHPLAENSAAELVLVDLYQSISTEERGERFAELEKIAPLLKTTSGRLNYHLNMGYGYIDFGGSRSKAIKHLLAADTEGISRWQVEAATWITIAELARAEGQIDIATAYYGKFLEKYKRDNRHYTMQERLESMLAKIGNE